MGDAVTVAVGLAAGLVLGAGFFEGLRHTVGRVTDARRPALLVAGSFAMRMAILAALLVALARAGGGSALVAAAAGILLARTAVLRRARSGGGAWS